MLAVIITSKPFRDRILIYTLLISTLLILLTTSNLPNGIRPFTTSSTDTAFYNGKLVTRAFVEKLLSDASANIIPITNQEDFRLVANGVHQSDGSISATLNGSGIRPQFHLVQNLYPQSLVFFTQL